MVVRDVGGLEVSVVVGVQGGSVVWCQRGSVEGAEGGCIVGGLKWRLKVQRSRRGG